MTRSSDILLVMALALVTAWLSLSGLTGPALIVLGSIQVAFLPGYAFITAFVPSNELDAPQAITFSLGTSMGIAVIGGLLLHLTPWGLKRETWTVFLSGLTIVCGVIGLARRRLIYTEREAPRSVALPRLRAEHFALFVAALLIVSAAGYFSYKSAQDQARPGFTQFWMIKADSSETAAIIGITNNELSAQEYRVEVLVREQLIYESRQIILDVGDTWEQRVILTEAFELFGVADARLYRMEDPDVVYRSVKLTRMSTSED